MSGQLCYETQINYTNSINNRSLIICRLRDENLKRRGIDPNDNESQLKAIEDRGKEILEDYKLQKEYTMISTQEAENILEPVKNSLEYLGVGLGRKIHSIYCLVHFFCSMIISNIYLTVY